MYIFSGCPLYSPQCTVCLPRSRMFGIQNMLIEKNFISSYVDFYRISTSSEYVCVYNVCRDGVKKIRSNRNL